ncbi:hypothetical protein ABPG75_012481 [Micractinium tetrahymenae]
MASLRVQALHRLFPGPAPRRPNGQPAPLQQNPAAPSQRPHGSAPKHPLQNALAGLAMPLSLLPQGAAAQADPAAPAQQAQQAEERCEVVDPSDPALATRRELSKTIDMLLWGMAILLLCTCCPLGLLFSVVLSLGGAALAVVFQLAAVAQPEVLMQLAGSLGGLLDVSSLLSFFASLDASSLLVGATLALKKLWLLGLDVYSLLLSLALGVFKLGAGLALGVYKLGAGLALGVFKIAKTVVLAGADVWSLLVGGAVGVAKGTRAASSAWTERQQRRDDGGEEGDGEGGAAAAGAAGGAPSAS